MRRFRGTHVNKVDSKGRVSIPAKFRRAIEEGDPDWVEGDGGAPTMVLTYGLFGNPCLEGFTIREMDRVDDQIAEMPLFSKDRDAWEEIINGQSEELVIDASGRIVLPPNFRKAINATDQVVFVGMGQRFRIWSPEAHEARQGERRNWQEENAAKTSPFQGRASKEVRPDQMGDI